MNEKELKDEVCFKEWLDRLGQCSVIGLTRDGKWEPGSGERGGLFLVKAHYTWLEVTLGEGPPCGLSSAELAHQVATSGGYLGVRRLTSRGQRVHHS